MSTITERCLENYSKMSANEGFAITRKAIDEDGRPDLLKAIPMPPFSHAVFLDLLTDNVIVARLPDGTNWLNLLENPIKSD